MIDFVVAAELSTDYHLVVSWIRWLRRLLDRSGKPIHVVIMNFDHLVEAPFCKFFNSYLWKKFLGIPSKNGDMESKWALFKASIVEAAVKAVKLKKEDFRAWFVEGSPKVAHDQRPDRLLFLWSKQKPLCDRSLGMLWRGSFAWPLGISGKQLLNSRRESRAWFKLCLAGEEKC